MILKEQQQNKKKMSVWTLIVMDVTLTIFGMGMFLLFYYILPQSYSTSGVEVVSTVEETTTTFSLPSDSTTETSSSTETTSTSTSDVTSTTSTDTSDATDTDTSSTETTSTETTSTTSSGRSGSKNTGNTGTTQITADVSSAESLVSEDIVSTILETYSDENIDLTITEKVIGTGDDTVTYYVADIYVTSVEYVLSAFAEDTYGKNIKDTIANMAEESNAVLAVNGDFYGDSEEGMVIRNGVLYRSDVVDADICVLFTDGTMATYSPEEFDADALIAQGAWQAWTFGPALLDGSGNVLSSFNTTSYINGENPRTAIGYVEPGHYVLVVVDGRDIGYSRGVTISELAAIMAEEGCQTAYNLDGGKSSAMVFQGEYVNQPADGGREVSDIVYIGASE